MNRLRVQQGFTLIEVLVASAILVAALGVIMQLFGSGIDRLTRLSDASQLLVAEKEIYSRLNVINFAQQNEGEGTVAGMQYSWRAEQSEPFRPVSPYLVESDLRSVALFRVEISIERPGRDDAQWVLQGLGWRDGRG